MHDEQEIHSLLGHHNKALMLRIYHPWINDQWMYANFVLYKEIIKEYAT